MLARGSRTDIPRIPRVLVADDDARVRGQMVEALRGQCDVIEAIDGADALERLGELSLAGDRLPDAYVLDVRMPYLSGIHVMCAIRGCDHHVPIVLTTPREDFATISIAARWGAVLIEKPFDVSALCGAVLEVSRNTLPTTEPNRAYQPRSVRVSRPITS